MAAAVDWGGEGGGWGLGFWGDDLDRGAGCCCGWGGERLGREGGVVVGAGVAS